MRSQDAAWFALIGPLLLCAATADGTTMARMPIEKMAHVAQVIIRARCEAITTTWDAGEIWTLTTFDVKETWKGSPPARVTTRLLGGRLGGVTSSVAGIPRFLPGEDVVLFLEPMPNGDYTIVSWMQGTFRVWRDGLTGEDTVTQDTAGFDTFDPATRRFSASGIRNLGLQMLRERVAAALRTEGNGK